MSNQTSPNLIKIAQDIHMAAVSLNASLQNFGKLTDLRYYPHLPRMLEVTEKFLQDPDPKLPK